MDKDNCYNVDRIFCTKIIMETDTLFIGYKKYKFNINKFIYKIKPSYIFNLHSQCGKWSCQNR